MKILLAMILLAGWTCGLAAVDKNGEFLFKKVVKKSPDAQVIKSGDEKANFPDQWHKGMIFSFRVDPELRDEFIAVDFISGGVIVRHTTTIKKTKLESHFILKHSADKVFRHGENIQMPGRYEVVGSCVVTGKGYWIVEQTTKTKEN